MYVCFDVSVIRVDIDSSDDESDMDDDLELPAVIKSKHHDLMMKAEGSRKGSFFKQAKKSYPMFPTHEERLKWDEYGEVIRYCNPLIMMNILSSSLISYYTYFQVEK